MIEPPSITRRAACRVAAVHLDIPRDQMARHFGPALAELNAVLAAQGIAPAGPVVAHHLNMSPGRFDLDIAVPIESPVTAAGRVAPRDWPERRVATTVYHGPYEGLHGAWGAFTAWLATQPHATAPDLYETYLTDPAHEPDPAAYRTRLERPLA